MRTDSAGLSRRRAAARERGGRRGQGTVLAEARARRECALAYHATAEAVYEEAGRDAGARRSGDSQAAGNPEAGRPDMAECLSRRLACEQFSAAWGHRRRGPGISAEPGEPEAGS